MPRTATGGPDDGEPARRRPRKANNEGSVYPRKDGRWVGSAFVVHTDGTRRRVSVYGRTRQEANDRLVRLVAEDRQGIPRPSASQTVGEYLRYWLAEIARHKVRPSTLATYTTYVRCYMLPGLGHKRLARLSARDIMAWLATVRQTCQCCAQGRDAARPEGERRCCAVGRCCERRLSEATVHHLHRLLRAALQDAVTHELLARNVRVPVRRRHFQPYTLDEARLLLKAAKVDRLYALYAVALGVGLRRGEALGLRWSDVDTAAGVLHVRQTLQRVNGALVFQTPKTERSERTVPLPAPCLRALDAHRERQDLERARAGRAWQHHDLVFTTRDGGPIDPRNLVRSFVRLCDRAGVRRVRFHDLRHSCATLLYAHGVDPGTIQVILGHSSITVTMSVYVEIMREVQQDAVDRMTGLFDE